MPLISVVITAYNRADLLPRAVTSVQAQDFSDFEIVIVDDGSADNTDDVVVAMQRDDERIRYVVHPKNRGEAGARNTGLVAATGEYIAFLDSDDAWLPGKLRRQYDIMAAANGALDAVFTGNIAIWPDGQEVFDDVWHFHHPITVRNLLVRGCAFGLGTNALLRRTLALQAGWFDETLRLYVDADWLGRFFTLARVAAVAEPWAIYHKSPFRRGDMVEAAAAAYVAKNAALVAGLSWRDRGRMHAVHWRSAALGYRADGQRAQYIRTSWKALVCDPFVPLGSYIELLDAILHTNMVGWVRRIRRRQDA